MVKKSSGKLPETARQDCKILVGFTAATALV
jgi:hypothetical protein